MKTGIFTATDRAILGVAERSKQEDAMTDTQALIAELQAATEGSRELDADVHNLIFGRRSDRASPIPHIGSDPEILTYTTSLDAAVSLIPEGYGFRLFVPNHRRLAKTMLSDDWLDDDRLVMAYSKTTPLAICIAALKAGRHRAPDANGKARRTIMRSGSSLHGPRHSNGGNK